MADDQLIKGIRVATVGRIEIRVNWSVLVIAALIAWSLADGLLPEAAEGYSVTEYWIAGVAATVAFFGGLLAHELGHSAVARRVGLEVRTITLWLFGGVAELERTPTTPRDSMRIAAAGPAVSIALGVVALALAVLSGGLVGAALAWFGVISLLLAGFNLLPAYPMDGGRLYQAWRWQRSGDEVAATERAVEVGLWIGGAFVVLGIAATLAGGLLGGLWLAVIGWFIREAARAELQQVHVERPLKDVTIAEVMSADPLTVRSDTTISDFVSAMVFSGRHAAYPVTRPDGGLAGLVSRSDIAELPRDTWPAHTVAEVATPLDQVVTVPSSTSVSEVLHTIGRSTAHRALVVDDGRLVGIVAPSDIMRLVAIVELTGEAPMRDPPRRPEPTSAPR